MSLRWPPPSSMHRCTRVKKLRITAWSVFSCNVVRCANWGRPTRWLFTRDRAFFTPLPYPSTDCVWRWGFLLIPFTVKSAPSLCNWPRPNKQFHSTHTHTHTHTYTHSHTHTQTHTLTHTHTHTHTHVLLIPSAPSWLNLKVTAYVQIPALRDTLAEKHVTIILKCFAISATPCITTLHSVLYPVRTRRGTYLGYCSKRDGARNSG